jgi:hypothetical protein
MEKFIRGVALAVNEISPMEFVALSLIVVLAVLVVVGFRS